MSTTVEPAGVTGPTNVGKKPILAFLSDFGSVDDAVGMCKGHMLSICPDATIIDICHTVTPFDVRQGAHLLIEVVRFYPTSTVVAAVVYPETGTDVGVIAARVPQGHLYVAPNNGLLTHILEEYGFEEAYEVTADEILPAHLEPTIFGRDLIAGPASHLVAGFPLTKVGRTLDLSDIVTFETPGAESIEGQSLYGAVSSIDRPFGNVWTNVHSDLLKEHDLWYGTDLRITLDDALTFDLKLTRTFGNRAIGSLVAYVNSRGYLALARNQDDLANRYNLQPGMTVRVEAKDQAEAYNGDNDAEYAALRKFE